MKQAFGRNMRAPNSKRARGRANRRPPNPNRSFESNGPDGKIRGNANQVYDKYSQLARDAAASGDLVAAEGFWQHAEHYYRIMMSMQQNRQQNQSSNDGQDQNGQNDHNGRDQSDQGGRDQSDQGGRDQSDGGQTEAKQSEKGKGRGNEGGENAEQSADSESETAGLERTVRRSRPRRARRPRDDEDQGAPSQDSGSDEPRTATAEDAAD